MLKISILKKLIKEHSSFLLFVVKFLVCYLVMAGLYSLFLSQYNTKVHEVDAITTDVAKRTNNVLVFFNQEVVIQKHFSQPAYKVLVHHKYVARIVEGCNAFSVIILFASFIVAFSSTWKKTLVFILVGAILIYVLNIFRIALLTLGLFYYPKSKELLHDVVFPLVIYGVVFILWIFWVFKFYNAKTIDNEKG